MAYTIQVAGSEISFPCDEATTLLDAAQAAGYELPYSCRNGVCGNCRGQIRSGEVSAPPAGDGYLMFCQTRPRSDLVIVPRGISRVDPSARKVVQAKVYRVTPAADDVSLLQLRFPAGVKVKFKAGQYLDVLLEDGSRRSFSMANPPQSSDGALLHIRRLPGGKFSDGVLGTLVAGDVVRVELPFGDFYLREDSPTPMVLVASGTGFAPIKSMLEDMFRRGVKREAVLYWGGRREKDLYAMDLPQKWAAQHPWLRFVPVLSEPEAGWTGRTGFVHRAVMEDLPDLSGYQVYACGVTAMIEAARADFTARCGLPPDAFFCDAFVTPADQAAGAQDTASG